MGEIKYSKEQLEVIYERNKNILVSAAAGSGKTTVLVERIMSKILDRDHPIDVDRLLIMTYTNAAAAEMKERIEKRLYKALEQQPENQHLEKQTILIHNAKITTIHSFCLDLIKNHFLEAGVEPGFRIADDGEIKLIKEEAMERLIDDMFEKNITDLGLFLEVFENKDNYAKVKDAVATLYNEALKAPFVREYMNIRRHDYDYEDDINRIPWIKALVKFVKEELGELKILAEYNYKLSEDFAEKYIPVAMADLEIINNLCNFCSYTEAKEKFNNYSGSSFGRLPVFKENDEVKEQFGSNRKKIKDAVKELSLYFGFEEAEMKYRFDISKKWINTLVDITLLYDDLINREKRRRNIISFADMEHLALKILLQKEGEEFVPTDVARDYKAFYDEVMVDEYQDSNYIQETIMEAVSRDNNRFMVGDLKQSIYRFRNACPEIFIEKYKTYQSDGVCNKRIDLTANYRSRNQVINIVNTVFERNMNENNGGISYDEAARLYLGNKTYEENGFDYKPELMLIEIDKESSYNREEQEIFMIGNRIRQLIENGLVTDSLTGLPRKCRYSDIVILLRSTSGFAGNCKKILGQMGIPVYQNSKTGFFDSIEIQKLLNFLRVINNPTEEIYLYGTMKEFGDFTDEEMALVKIFGGDKLWEALQFLCKISETNAVNNYNMYSDTTVANILNKCNKFNEELSNYRIASRYTPINELLRKIISKYDYINRMNPLPTGEQKKANILMLLEKARHFEENGFKGIYSFNKYIEGLHKYGGNEGEAPLLDEKSDVVRIMTMHASKGLEFPVCILANMSKMRNDMDSRANLVSCYDYGLAADYVDFNKRCKYTDLRKKFISAYIKRENRSEELRVLYVAMTRAKEKLIMTGRVDSIEKIKGKSGSYLSILLSAREMDEWKDSLVLKEITLKDIIIDEVQNTLSRKELMEKFARDAENTTCDDMITYEMKYPHELFQNLYMKTTVTELKKKVLIENWESLSGDVFSAYEEQAVEAEYIPGFAKKELVKTGSKRGSAYHRVMELLDFSLGERPDIQIINKIKQGLLSEEEYGLVNINDIEIILDSSLGKRLRVAKQIYKEQPFVMNISANRLNSTYPADKNIMIQGIIDLYFREEDGIVLVDYKTDRVKSEEELVDKYAMQLDLYQEALEGILDERVKEKIIYSFYLKKSITLK